MTSVLCALALLVSLAGPARAETDAARARAYYVQGQADYNLGHFADALKNYEAAYKIKAVPALLFNIAQCHRQLGSMREAATTYKGYLRTAPETDPNRAKAETLLAEVEASVARQAQAQEARPLGPASDDPSKAAADGPPQIDASEVPATAVAANDPAAAHALPAGATTAPPVPAQKSSGRTLTWVAAGGTALALGVGVAFGLKSKSDSSSLSSSHHTTAQVDSISSDASSNAHKANALYAVGIGLAAVTATFFVLKF